MLKVVLTLTSSCDVTETHERWLYSNLQALLASFTANTDKMQLRQKSIMQNKKKRKQNVISDVLSKALIFWPCGPKSCTKSDIFSPNTDELVYAHWVHAHLGQLYLIIMLTTFVHMSLNIIN